MDRRAVLSCLLIVLLCGDNVVSGLSWPPYPGAEGIRSSVCQKKLGCEDKNFATLYVCKGFCLGRKRFWQKCGPQGTKDEDSKVCNPFLAQAVEKASKGIILVTDLAVREIFHLLERMIEKKLAEKIG